MSELAKKLIAENKRTKDTFLDLGNCGLTSLPAELLELTHLESLTLGAQNISKKMGLPIGLFSNILNKKDSIRLCRNIYESLQVGDTILKEKGATKFFIKKKDKILVFEPILDKED